MTHQIEWDVYQPDPSDIVRYGPEIIQRFTGAFGERFAIDHIVGSSQAEGADQDGVHSQLTMPTVSNTLLLPVHGGTESNPTDCITLFTQVVNGIPEVFMMNAKGIITQITSAGFLNGYVNSFLSGNSETKNIYFGRSTIDAYLIGQYGDSRDSRTLPTTYEITGFTDLLSGHGLSSAVAPSNGTYLVEFSLDLGSLVTNCTAYYLGSYGGARPIKWTGFLGFLLRYKEAGQPVLTSMKLVIAKNNFNPENILKEYTLASNLNMYGANTLYMFANNVSNISPWDRNTAFPDEESFDNRNIRAYLFSEKYNESYSFKWSGNLATNDAIKVRFEMGWDDTAWPYFLYMYLRYVCKQTLLMQKVG